MLSAKRLRQHATLFGALLGVVALVSGLSVGVIGYLSQAATRACGPGSRLGPAGSSLCARRCSSTRIRRLRIATCAPRSRGRSSSTAAPSRSPSIAWSPARRTSHEIDRRRARRPAAGLRDQPRRNRGSRDPRRRRPGRRRPDEVTMQADAAERLELAPGDRVVLGRASSPSPGPGASTTTSTRAGSATRSSPTGTRSPTTARSSSTSPPGRGSTPTPACAGPSCRT